MYFSEVFLSETEDRLNARYYGSQYVSLTRKLRKLAQEPDFELKSLGSISSRVKKGIFYILASEYKEKGVPFIRVSDIKNMTVDMSEVVYISEKRNRQEKKTVFQPRDIVVSKGGTIGRSAIIPRWIFECNISQDIIGISIKKRSKVKPEYIATFLMSRLGRLQMERIKTQQMQPHLTLGCMKELKILYCLKDHKDIVDAIQTAENMNVKSYKKIEEAMMLFYRVIGIDKESRFKSRSKTFQISSMELEDALTPRFYNPQHSRLLKLAKEYHEVVPLKSLASISRGNEVGSKNYRSYLEKDENDIPFIRTSDIVNWEIDTYPDYYVSEEIAEKIDQDIKPRDVLFTKDGKIGFSAVVTEEDRCIVSSGFALLRINPKLNNYCFLVLASKLGVSQAWQRTVIASTIPHLKSPERLGEIQIPVIDKTSRQKIKKLVGEAFRLKGKRKKLIAKCLERMEHIVTQ